MKMKIIWDISPCTLVGVDRSLVGAWKRYAPLVCLQTTRRNFLENSSSFAVSDGVDVSSLKLSFSGLVCPPFL
jgi:hypothetical protein